MEINYDNTIKNYDKYYNDLINYYAANNKILEKNKKIIYYKDYNKSNLINLISFIFLDLILIISIIIIDIPIYRIICLLLLNMYVIAAISIIIFLKKNKENYKILKNNLNNSKGKVIINKDGIKDIIDNNELLYGWNNLKCCIISKETIFIIYKTNRTVLFFPRNIEDKLIKATKKYNKSFKIIYLEEYIKKEK